MILVLILIAIILIVAAIRDKQGELFGALKTDVPAFGTWAAAIIAIGLLGFIPGFKPVSRGLLALVIVVLVINNYDKILVGFNHTWQSSGQGSGGTTNG